MKNRCRLFGALLVIGGLLLLPSCLLPAPGSGDGGDAGPTQQGVDAADNGTFKSAAALPLDSGALTFSGSIESQDDVDVFDLGELRAGDRLTVDVIGQGGLDLVMTIFDAAEDIQAFNDDRDEIAGDLDPYLNITIRGQTGTYYLALASFSGLSSGDYQAFVRIEPGDGRPAAEPLLLYLDWRGGRISRPTLGTFELAPFDATQVGLASSQTASLKQQVRDIVAERYSRFQATILSSDDADPPSESHSVVYFGGNNSRAFALAEKIDVHNQDKSDIAVVFTLVYAEAFAHAPSFDQMATALGNTVAHEVGHLLGLVHTRDCDELMDAACVNEALLSEQQFDRAPLHPTTFPIGYQDAAKMLAWLLGLEP